METKQNIDDIFRNKLEAFEVEPPVEAWTAISSNIPNEKKDNKKYLIFIKIAAVLAIPISISAYIFLHSANTSTSKSPSFANIRNNSQYLHVNSSTQNTNNLKENHNGVSGIKKSQNHSTVGNSNTHNSINPTTIQAGNSSIKKDQGIRSIQKYKSTNILPVTDQLALVDSNNSLLGSLKNIYSRKAILETESNKKENSLKLIQRPESEDIISMEQMEYLGLTETKPKKSVWMLGGNAGPIYSYRNSNNNTMNSSTSYNNTKESGIISYAGGVNIEYHTTKRLSIQSGVYYSKIGQNIKDVPTQSVDEINSIGEVSKARDHVIVNTSMGSVSENDQKTNTHSIYYSQDFASAAPNNSYTTTNIIQNLEFIEIPMNIRYKVSNKKIGISVSGGMNTHILVGNTATNIGNNIHIENSKTYNLKNLNYSAAFGLGFSYPLTSKSSITIEPTFKYYINSITTERNLKTHPYYIGLLTGISFSL